MSLLAGVRSRLFSDDADPTGLGVADRQLLRILLVAAQGLTIAITWRLWQTRAYLPNLPLVDGLRFDFGWLLLGSLALVLVRPLGGLIAHSLLLAVAIAADQMRIQPEFISLAILMWATLPWTGAVMLGRAHLFAMWLYAGGHKLLSAGYWNGGGREMWQQMFPWLADRPAATAAGVAAIYEVLLAVLLLFPRTRRVAAVMAALIHVGILLGLSLGRNWNSAVWPWNAVLAVAAVSLLWDWRAPLGASILRCGWAIRAAIVVLVVTPAGYYVGLVDAYLAHCLYSVNTPSAWLICDEGEVPLHDEALRELNVPFSPSPRLYEAFFRAAGGPDDALEIVDPRPIARARGLDQRTLTRSGERRHGLRQGLWTQWYPSGQMKSQTTFRDDIAHGHAVEWYQDGRKKSEGEFLDGEVHGQWTFWEPDGTVRHGQFDRGALITDLDLR